MRSLVLDQSTTTTGACVVENCPDEEIYPGFPGKLLWHGRLMTPAKTDLPSRLMILEADIQELINSFKPDELVIENTTYIKQRTGETANAMGAIFVSCQKLAKLNGLAFYTQNPGTIKKKITGNGAATKEDVKKAVCQYYRMQPWQLKDDNHADALAAAFIWLYMGDEIREARKGRRN